MQQKQEQFIFGDLKNSTWMPIGTLLVDINGNITKNITSDITSYIDVNKHFVIAVEGDQYEPADYLYVDHVQ